MDLKSDTFSRLCRAREILGDLALEELPLDTISREVGMSHFHFIRQFEALFGSTPHQFRIGLRIERAKVLLAKGNHSVTDVCFEVGCSSLGTFSDLFKRRAGMSPSEYRNSARILAPVPGVLPPALFPGCLNLMGRLPAAAFRNFREASSPLLR